MDGCLWLVSKCLPWLVCSSPSSRWVIAVSSNWTIVCSFPKIWILENSHSRYRKPNTLGSLHGNSLMGKLWRGLFCLFFFGIYQSQITHKIMNLNASRATFWTKRNQFNTATAIFTTAGSILTVRLNNTWIFWVRISIRPGSLPWRVPVYPSSTFATFCHSPAPRKPRDAEGSMLSFCPSSSPDFRE